MLAPEGCVVETAVDVRGLTKRYGATRAVDGASFEVRQGEIFGIIGPNGSGKTTTVECLQGLRKRDSGEARVLGLDPEDDRNALHHRIGSQLQESALPERLRVWEALDLFAALSPRSRNWRELLEEWDLVAKRNTAFADLSGGQRQRLFVALALVNEPEIVFLDEMATGLDPAARRAAWDLVREVRRRGTTVVLVTHFMDEAEELCDRIALFRSGQVAALDTPAGLVERFAAGTTVRFTAGPGDFEFLRKCPGFASMTREGSRIAVTGEGPLLAHVAAALVAHDIAPLDLMVERPTLEDAYINLSREADA